VAIKGIPGSGAGNPFCLSALAFAVSGRKYSSYTCDRKALTEIKKDEKNKDEKNKDEKNKDRMRATIELSEVPVHLMASTLAPREARRRLL
jgi:hypothetical protein